MSAPALTPAQALRLIAIYAQMADSLWCDPPLEAKIEIAALHEAGPAAMPLRLALLACRTLQTDYDDEDSRSDSPRSTLARHALSEARGYLENLATPPEPNPATS